MEIIIKGDPKEIAALVVAIQERRNEPNSTLATEGLQRLLDAGGCGLGIKLCADHRLEDN